jgi:hypothetical protein
MLKAAIIARPPLALPKPGCQYLMRIDAPDFDIGGTLRLFQREDDDNSSVRERIIAYFLRKPLDAKKRYSTYSKDLLAVRDAITNWRYYLHGNDWCGARGDGVGDGANPAGSKPAGNIKTPRGWRGPRRDRGVPEEIRGRR